MTTTIDFAMPSLGADMEEGRITEWLVSPGDHVDRGQVVVVVETDKSDIDVEVFEPGIVDELLVAEGDLVAVGVPIARVRPDLPSAADTTSATSAVAPGRPVLIDDARRGPLRRHIATTMARAWSDIPHYHVARRLDLSNALARLDLVNRSAPLADRIVPSILLLCAAARAASEVPECNGWWRRDQFEPSETVDLGLVVSLRTGGIIVPVIRDAASRTPLEMMRLVSTMVDEARSGRLRSTHAGEASITVTNLGDRGADMVLGVIHPPQVSLVGFGTISPSVVVDDDGQPAVRSTTLATLSGDHRATDGLTGSRFLERAQHALDALAADLCDEPAT